MKSSASTANGQEVPSSVVTKLTVLGATGSIGLNTLEIVRQFPHKFKIEALSCRSSIERLVEQIKEFQPRLVCVDNSEQARELRETFSQKNYGTETEFVWIVEGLYQEGSFHADILQTKCASRYEGDLRDASSYNLDEIEI